MNAPNMSALLTRTILVTSVVGLFAGSPLAFAAASKARGDPVIEQADRAFRACMAEYDRNPMHGADRAMMACEQQRRGVLESTTKKVWEQIERAVPTACKAAVASLQTASANFYESQMAFSESIVRPEPGRGETDKSVLDTLAAQANYRYVKSLQTTLSSAIETPLRCDR